MKFSEIKEIANKYAEWKLNNIGDFEDWTKTEDGVNLLIHKHKLNIICCVECEKIVGDWEPNMCCSGRDCGCLGLPTNPPICDSDECYEKFMNKYKK